MNILILDCYGHTFKPNTTKKIVESAVRKYKKAHQNKNVNEIFVLTGKKFKKPKNIIKQISKNDLIVVIEYIKSEKKFFDSNAYFLFDKNLFKTLVYLGRYQHKKTDSWSLIMKVVKKV